MANQLGTFKLESTGKTVTVGILTGEGPSWELDPNLSPSVGQTYDIAPFERDNDDPLPYRLNSPNLLN